MVNLKRQQWVAYTIVGLSFFSSAKVAFSQSFLDKLESVVRDKLNTQVIDPRTPADPKPTGEELPAPNRPKSTKPNQNNGGANSTAPNSNPTAMMPSILENRPLVPPPKNSEGDLQLAPSQGNSSSSETAESAGVYLGLEVEELVGGGIGVRVSGLSDQSPAWKAGFKVGDLLQAIDGHAIADIDGMADRLRRVVPGKPTKFLVKRSGRNTELTAVLQNAALANRLGATTGQLESALSGPAYLGVLVSDLTPAFRSQFGLAVYSGAAVTNVAQGSPAQRAGLQPGDAIVEINGAPVSRGDDLMRWMAGAQIGQPAELMVYRGTQPSNVSLVLSGEPNSSPINDRARISSRPPVNGPVSGQARPANTLQVEVEQLRAELEQTQQQLLQTQKRLDQVLQQLEQNR